MKTRMVLLRCLEKVLSTVGLILVTVYLTATAQSQISAGVAIQKINAVRWEAHPASQESDRFQSGENLDFNLRSEHRVSAYTESMVNNGVSTSAVLCIPKLRLEVPVFDGTDDLALKQGIGRIPGTAKPGLIRNSGIAGYRDGVFRGPKDIGRGDKIELLLTDQAESYVVAEIQITSPADFSVLQPTSTPFLTPVTCYPFYFVGSAPQGYIVRASASSEDPFSQLIRSNQIKKEWERLQ